jgi:hypothetical protein
MGAQFIISIFVFHIHNLEVRYAPVLKNHLPAYYLLPQDLVDTCKVTRKLKNET